MQIPQAPEVADERGDTITDLHGGFSAPTTQLKLYFRLIFKLQTNYNKG